MTESQDRRVLGAMRFLDATTGSPLHQALRIDSPPGVRLVRNLSGYYVIQAARGLEAYTNRFENPVEVRDPGPSDTGAVPFGSQTLTFTINDPSGAYLPRLATCSVPRVSNLPRPGEPFPDGWQPGELFSTVDVPLFRSAAAAKELNWAVVYASIANEKTRAPLGGALVRVLRNGAGRIGGGLADDRGEAMVAIAGLPRLSWPEDDAGSPEIVTELDATLEVVWNRAAGATVDPGLLEKNRETLVHQSFPIKLSAGRSTKAVLLVKVNE